MLHFEGEKDFSQAPQEVFAKLCDAGFLVHCVPDAEAISVSQRDKATCKVRPGFAFVRGTLDIVMTVTEAVALASVKLHLASKGIGASSEVEAALAFSAKDSGTKVKWTADLKKLGGLLKMVPKGLIQGAAQSVIDDVWANVQARVNEKK